MAKPASPAGDGQDASSSSSSSSGSLGREQRSRSPRRPKAKPPAVPFSLAALEAEVEALRREPPEYVRDVGRLRTPSMVCDSQGQMVKPEGEGPWDLGLSICGEEGDEAYGHWFRVSLQFDRDLWPMKLAVVRFCCVFHHALADEGGGMLMPFYRAMPRDERGACTVHLVLKHLRGFLEDPLGSWKLPAEGLPATVNKLLDEHREMNAGRFEVIKKYAAKRRHPELFESPPRWREEWLDPAFYKASQDNTPEGWRAILQEHLKGEVFSFRIFTEPFCQLLVDEIFGFYASGLPARRPNSMNNYGIVLNEIGLEPLIAELQRLLQPLGELLFPGPGSGWDGQHCFIVRYRSGEDLGLDMHTDDSDVTFNVCLGLDFAGAGLQFCGLMGAPNHRRHTHTYHHVKGSCVCHLGRKRHGADDISSGERLNLILWNHSSQYRQSDEYIKPEYHREAGPPDVVCVSYTHDRDFGNYKEYPKGKENHKGRGWCPRKLYEYSGFKPDCEVEKVGV